MYKNYKNNELDLINPPIDCIAINLKDDYSNLSFWTKILDFISLIIISTIYIYLIDVGYYLSIFF